MDFQRLFDIFPYQQAKYSNKIALATKRGLQWETYSTESCIEQINCISAGLLQLGLVRGDKIAMVTYCGSPIWTFLDMGMQQIGVIVVPIHASITERELILILNEVNVKYCIVQNRELLHKIYRVKSNVLTLKKVFTLERLPDESHWSELSITPNAKHLETIQTIKAAIHEDDLATISYTSGTSGQLKGVMLSHKNIISNIKALLQVAPISCDKVAASFLPPSNAFERMITYAYMAAGASLYFLQTTDNLIDELQDIRPNYFTAVPRLLEKAYYLLLEKLDQSKGFSRKLQYWAIRAAEKYAENKLSIFNWIEIQIFDLIVYRKWRKMTGNRIEGIIVGAAALQPRLSKLFNAAGFTLREGYGLTETSPLVALNRFEPNGWRSGTVGMTLPGIEIAILQPNEFGEGEILVKGANVMLGYYQQTAATREVFTEDGWFKTGDVGKIVQKRFLQITDRKKSIFQTSTGHFIAPQPIEQVLATSPYVAQCLVVGKNRPNASALIVPNFQVLERWCKEQLIAWSNPTFMVIQPEVEQFFQALINTTNNSLKEQEKIKAFQLLAEEWTLENGLATSILKPKREAIELRWHKEIQEMYLTSNTKLFSPNVQNQ